MKDVSEDLEHFADSVGLQSSAVVRALVAGALRSGSAERLLEAGLPYAGQAKARGKSRAHWTPEARPGFRAKDWLHVDGYRLRFYGSPHARASSRTADEGWRLLPPSGPAVRLQGSSRVDAQDEADLLIRSGRV